MSTEDYRAVVCGTTFGQVYLEGLSRAQAPVRLAGIVAAGSERSAACAKHYGVPLVTRLADLPAGVSIACVVVRSGLLGGRGTELAAELMTRGVHVLQEHPVHHDELAGCLRAARRHGVQYRLNSFYPDLPPVRGFLRAASALLRRHPARYVTAACAFQVGYALLDVITTAVGRSRPWEFSAGAAALGPFRVVSGRIGGVPLSLRIQYELDPANPDAGELLLHQVTLGTDAGELTLAGSHGPVLWTDRPRIPADVRDSSVPMYQLSGAGSGECWTLLWPSGAPGAPGAAGAAGTAGAAGQHDPYRLLWPAAAASAVARLAADITAGSDPLREGQRHLELCRMWQRLAELLGPPARVPDRQWEPLDDGDRQSLARAAAGTAAGGSHGAREATWQAMAR